jgi:hypothetical protein
MNTYLTQPSDAHPRMSPPNPPVYDSYPR